jgi:hypothetical protein
VRRRESPIKRANPSGEVVWVARYTGRDGRRRIAKPTWNDGKGTFDRKHEAQRAIDEAYERSDRPDSVGQFFESWTERYRGRSGPMRLTSIASVPSSTCRWRGSR